MKHITDSEVLNFQEYLLYEEKAAATVEKYIRDIKAFMGWLSGRELDKKTVLAYKEHLREIYSVSSVNSVISAINSFFDFKNLCNLKIKTIKRQRQIFASCDKELTRAEYYRLLEEASKKGNERLNLVMQTICSTGIRVSEDI